MTRKYQYLLKVVFLAVMLISAGCVSSDISDLQQWIDEVLTRPGGRIDPIPEIKPYEAYSYKALEEGKRDPFTPFYQERREEIAEIEQDAGLSAEMEREIKNRNRETLESFELDSMRMVGIIQSEENNWAIIKDPDGTVHKVKVGNYLGRNIGKIVNIFEDRVELREIIQNNQGRWEERQAAIALAEVQ